MPGTNCSTCIFAQWKDQSQVGCLFGRTEKYQSIDIFNDEYNGTYKILPENICSTKRNKSWLSNHPQQPDKVVRQEVYPKIQLFLMIDKLTQDWVDFFAQADLSKYSAVDIMLFLPEKEYIKSIGYLLRYANIFIHACTNDKDWQINYIVRDDCQYYVQFDEIDTDQIKELPDRLDYYINDLCKSVVMIQPKFNNGNNGLLVSIYMHNYVGGYGSQTVEEKISIDCENNFNNHLMVLEQDFLDATKS